MPPPPPAPPTCDKDVIDHAVLRELMSRNVSSSMFDSLATLEFKKAKIQKIREWSSQLSEKVVRSKYAGWLNHFERETDSYIKEAKNPKPKRTGPSEYEVMTEKIAEYEKLSPLPRFPL